MNKSLINPFELLGIDEQSTLKDARKSYYNLAMICHPDQGGDEKNMKILANAYKFVELQLKSVNNVNQNIGEDLEKEFEKFNISVKAEILPMRDLFDLAHDDFNKKFNEKFQEKEEEKYEFAELVAGDPFSAGYGYLMDTDIKEEEEKEIPTTRQRFSSEIIIYNDPQLLPNTYGNNLRYDITDIKDFTENQGNLKMNDYHIAHRELENVPTDFKSNMDTPIKDLSKLVKLKEEERKKEFDSFKLQPQIELNFN
tara:strand:- start:63 stop:824 length:762 start_codon:yes stop_codon:yes gene_type:complete